MPETGGTAYASFAALHEDRLVLSVVSETGLSAAVAAQVAADVLPAAHERSFATCGAAYGWLRVAARHRAAGSPGWAEAADAALGCADAALTVLAALPAEDRELLRLRYVDGLLPAALAARLETTVPDVLARLDRAQQAATAAGRPLPRRSLASRVSVPLPRAAAAAALAAAAVVTSLSGPLQAPNAVPPHAGAPWAALPGDAATGTRPVADEVPLPASDDRGSRGLVAYSGSRTPGTLLPPDDSTPPGGGASCRTGCTKVDYDELHVDLPKEVAEPVGRRDVVIKQEVGQEQVSLCEVTKPVPPNVARCVPRES